MLLQLPQLCEDYQEIVCGRSWPHSLEYLKDAVPKLLEHHQPHGLVLDTNYVGETINYLLKVYYYHYSDRGGGAGRTAPPKC